MESLVRARDSVSTLLEAARTLATNDVSAAGAFSQIEAEAVQCGLCNESNVSCRRSRKSNEEQNSVQLAENAMAHREEEEEEGKVHSDRPASEEGNRKESSGSRSNTRKSMRKRSVSSGDEAEATCEILRTSDNSDRVEDEAEEELPVYAPVDNTVPHWPITDIKIAYGNDHPPDGYDRILLSATGAYTANLNKGNTGKATYLCVRRDHPLACKRRVITGIIVVRSDFGEFVPSGFQCATRTSTSHSANLFGEKSVNKVAYLCFTKLPGSPITGITVCHPAGSPNRDRRNASKIYSDLVDPGSRDRLRSKNVKKGKAKKERRGTIDASSPAFLHNVSTDVGGDDTEQLPKKRSNSMAVGIREDDISFPRTFSKSSLKSATAGSEDAEGTFEENSAQRMSVLASIGVVQANVNEGSSTGEEVLPQGWTCVSNTLYGHSAGFPTGDEHQSFLALRKNTSHLRYMRLGCSRQGLCEILQSSKICRSTDDSVVQGRHSALDRQRSNSECIRTAELPDISLDVPSHDSSFPHTFTWLLPIIVHHERSNSATAPEKVRIEGSYSGEHLRSFRVWPCSHERLPDGTQYYSSSPTVSEANGNIDVLSSVSAFWVARRKKGEANANAEGTINTERIPSGTEATFSEEDDDDSSGESVNHSIYESSGGIDATEGTPDGPESSSPPQESLRKVEDMKSLLILTDPLQHLNAIQWVSTGVAAFMETPSYENLTAARWYPASTSDDDFDGERSWNSSPAAAALTPFLTALYSRRTELLHLALANLTSIIEFGLVPEDESVPLNPYALENARVIIDYVVATISDASHTIMNEIHEFIGAFSEAVIKCDFLLGANSLRGLSPLTWHRLIGLHFGAIVFCEQKYRSLKSASERSQGRGNAFAMKQLELDVADARRSIVTSWRAAYKFIESFVYGIQHCGFRNMDGEFFGERHVSACSDALSSVFWSHSSASSLFALDINAIVSSLGEEIGHCSSGWVMSDVGVEEIESDTESLPSHPRRDWMKYLRSSTAASVHGDLAVFFAMICRSLSPRAVVSSVGGDLDSFRTDTHWARKQRVSMLVSLRMGLLLLKKLLERLPALIETAHSCFLTMCMKCFVIPSLMSLGHSQLVCDSSLFLPCLECLRLLWDSFRSVLPSQLSSLFQVFIQAPLLCQGTNRAVTHRKFEVLRTLMHWLEVPHELLRLYTLLDLHAGRSMLRSLIGESSLPKQSNSLDADSPSFFQSTLGPFARPLLMIIRSITFAVSGFSSVDWVDILQRSRESESTECDDSIPHLQQKHTVSFRREGLHFLRVVTRILMDSAATASYTALSQSWESGTSPNEKTPAVVSHVHTNTDRDVMGFMNISQDADVTGSWASSQERKPETRTPPRSHQRVRSVELNELRKARFADGAPNSTSKSTRFLGMFNRQTSAQTRPSSPHSASDMLRDTENEFSDRDVDRLFGTMDRALVLQLWSYASYSYFEEKFLPCLLLAKENGKKALKQATEDGPIYGGDAFSQVEFLKSTSLCWSKGDMGEILGSGALPHSTVPQKQLEEAASSRRLLWMLGLDLRNRPFMEALRHCLEEGGFQLGGEGQVIDRFSEAFGSAYYMQNRRFFPESDEVSKGIASRTDSEGRLWPSNKDVCYVVSYAAIFLNTLVHNPSATRAGPPPTFDGFKAMVKEADDGKPLPEEFVSLIYHDISERPIKPDRKTFVNSDNDELAVLEPYEDSSRISGRSTEDGEDPLGSFTQIGQFINSVGISSRYFDSLLHDMNTVASSLESLQRLSVFCRSDPAGKGFAKDTVSGITTFLQSNGTAMQRLGLALKNELEESHEAAETPLTASVRGRATKFLRKMLNDAVISVDDIADQSNGHSLPLDNESSIHASIRASTFGVSSVLMLFFDILRPVINMVKDILESVRRHATGAFVNRVHFHIDYTTVSEMLDIVHHLLCSAVLLKQADQTVELLGIFSEAETLICSQDKESWKPPRKLKSSRATVEDLNNLISRVFPEAVSEHKTKTFKLRRKKKGNPYAPVFLQRCCSRDNYYFP
eukprot:gb/GECG01004764.1/.p1 GENE.gb/GECG01004764.1/~~gb/GECG01004764.1/.p1  ORF type:complete len:2027 (+),score=244.36 gb/GECG01004764.1/:1-6081(+)